MSERLLKGPFAVQIGELFPPNRPRSNPALTKVLPNIEGHREATKKANRFGSSWIFYKSVVKQINAVVVLTLQPKQLKKRKKRRYEPELRENLSC